MTIPEAPGPGDGTSSRGRVDAAAPLGDAPGAVRKTTIPVAARTPPAMKLTVERVAIDVADLSSVNPGEVELVVHDTGLPLQAAFALDQSEAAMIPDTAPRPSPTTPAPASVSPRIFFAPRPVEEPAGASGCAPCAGNGARVSGATACSADALVA